MQLNQKPICLLIFGPQASGKGTQAVKLAKDLELSILSTGGLLKSVRNQRNEIAKEIKKYYDKGQLVPDILVMKLIKNKINSLDLTRGVIFDGFPRNPDQIQLFERLIGDYNFKKTLAIYLKINRNIVIERIVKRKICDRCNRPYLPTDKSYQIGLCQICGGRIIARLDDATEAVKKRLDIYYQKTLPVIDYFKEKGNLVEINGAPDINTVYNEIINKLSDRNVVLK